MKGFKGSWLSFLPIPVLIVLVAVLHFTVDPRLVYEPKWLILIGNTVFITVVSLLVSFIALRTYRATGRFQLLLLGCGVLAFGVGAVCAAAVRSLPDGANLNVTIYNAAALLGSLFHFAAAFLLVAGISPETGSARRGLWAGLGYGGSTLLVAALSLAAIAGLTPPFKIAGTLGFTPLRQAVLGSADVLFGFSFVIFIGMYLRNREVFLHWYASALALTAISLTAFFIQRSVGCPVGWTGRVSQYLGGVYFLIALGGARRSAQSRQMSLDRVLTESLSGAEEKFRALAENSPDMIRRFNREMKHLYANPACLQLYGRTAAEVVGRRIDQVGLPEPQAADWRKRLSEVIKTGRGLDVEEDYPGGAGRRFYQSLCVPEFGPDGSVANVLVASRDVTERRYAEEALRESERRWATTLASIGDAVIATDGSGTVTFMNRAAEELTGWTMGEAAGRPVAAVFHVLDEKTGADVENPVAEVLRGGAIVALTDGSVLLRKDATEVPIDDSAAPIKDDDGKTLGGVLIFRDISQRKRAEEALRRQQRELEAMNYQLEGRVRERTAQLEHRTAQLRSLAMELTQSETSERKRLAAVIHDHLQQLLVGAKLGIQLAQRQDGEDSRTRSIQNVMELLDESIKVSRSLTVELSPPILHEGGLVPAVKWLARWMEEKNGLGVEVIADVEVSPGVEAVSTLLFQSIRELLFNVIKHAGVRQARVSIGKTADQRLLTVVTDEGAGFDVARAEARGSEASFGLFSIRERLELLGGQVDIDSAPGRGTRVSLITHLPARPAPAGTPAPGAPAMPPVEERRAAGPRAGRRIRVLVADDHKIMREGLTKLIQAEADMEVVGEASDGREAVELACRLHPDVIVMDMAMPRMNGVEATRKIAGQMPEIRVIALSMYEKGDYEETMRKAGARSYLTKDGPSENLIAAIRGSLS